MNQELVLRRKSSQFSRCPDDRLAVGTSKGALLFDGIADLNPLELRGTSDLVLSLAWSDDGRYLAGGTDSGQVVIWDTHKPATDPKVIQAHTGYVRALAFRQDGQSVLSGGDDGLMKGWHLDTEKLAKLVCSVVWRDLSKEEWDTHVGDAIVARPSCP